MRAWHIAESHGTHPCLSRSSVTLDMAEETMEPVAEAELLQTTEASIPHRPEINTEVNAVTLSEPEDKFSRLKRRMREVTKVFPCELSWNVELIDIKELKEASQYLKETGERIERLSSENRYA